MMLLARVEFVAVGAVAEVAPAHEIDLFKSREHPINGHQIALPLLQTPVQLFRRKRPVLVRENFEHRLPRARHPLPVLTQRIERQGELRAAGRAGVNMCEHRLIQ